MREVHRLRALDVRNYERAGSVLALHVDGDAEVDILAIDACGLPVLLDERGVHARMVFHRLHDRPGNDVRERCFRLAVEREVIVDHAPVLLQRLHRDRAHRRRRGDRQ